MTMHPAPAEEQPAAGNTASAETPHAGAFESGQGLSALTDASIMMVDDDSVLIEVLQTALEEEGYHNFIATTHPLKALDMIREARPDVIFLDMVMPRMSGLEVLAQIRADRVHCHTPVIVLTASSDRKVKLDALKLGASDFLSKPLDPSELALRLRNTLSAKAYQDRLAYCDAVTGLPNRRMLVDRLAWTCKHALRHGKRGVLLHVNIDRFKQVNAALGPGAGDMVLRQFGERLTGSVRSSDSIARFGQAGASPSLSRLGGDDFCLLLPEVESAESAALVARRVLDALHREPFLCEDQEVFMTASVGLAAFPDDGEDADTLLQNAGAALREAKGDGGNQYRFYAKDLHTRALKRLSVESELRRALEREELRVHFQPKVDTRSLAPTGAEALVRWQHPERGLIGPAEFVGVSESCGLIAPLGEWVLQAACRQAAAWKKSGLDALPISVNVSALQFRESNFVAAVERALSANQVEAGQLCIELTETVILDKTAQTAAALAQLRDLGVKLSIDDFGAGFTSLSYLKRLPFTELKIDKSFIDDIEHDADSAGIVAAVIALAHSLGLRVVAEGVENNAQHALLKARSCDECQGYLFSRPLSSEVFEAWLRKARDARAPLRAVV